MKVSELQNFLSGMNPDDHICALIYDKSLFDYDETDDVELTTENWEKLCKQFDENPFADIWESIAMGVLDYATPREVPDGTS